MIKKMVGRGLVSMAFSGFINQIVVYIMTLAVKEEGFIPLVPSFSQQFSSPVQALIMQFFLVGLIGGAFGAFSVFFEIETWSFLKQGILHLLATSIVWIPIAVNVWGLNKYPSAVCSTIIGFVITYGITWICNYLRCKRTIEAINEKIQLRKREEVMQ